MTRYENQVVNTRVGQFVYYVVPVSMAFVTLLIFSNLTNEGTFLQWFISLAYWGVFYHWLLSKITAFRNLANAPTRGDDLYDRAFSSMEQHYARYPVFSSNKPFHELYELEGKSLEEFEKAMAAGMWYCGREVYVAAFVKDDIIIRVSTSVGDLTSCGPEEDICDWISLCKSLGCDYIREYHNHPCFDGYTGPSEADKNFHKKAESILNPKRIDIDSFIIYWNEVAEWKLMQYDASGYAATVKCFDANEQQIITLSKPKRSVSAMIDHYYFEYEKVSNRRK